MYSGYFVKSRTLKQYSACYCERVSNLYNQLKFLSSVPIKGSP